MRKKMAGRLGLEKSKIGKWLEERRFQECEF
jgi:hypothetical protein